MTVTVPVTQPARSATFNDTTARSSPAFASPAARTDADPKPAPRNTARTKPNKTLFNSAPGGVTDCASDMDTKSIKTAPMQSTSRSNASARAHPLALGQFLRPERDQALPAAVRSDVRALDDRRLDSVALMLDGGTGTTGDRCRRSVHKKQPVNGLGGR